MIRRIVPLVALLLAACQSLPPNEHLLNVNDLAGRLKDYDGQTIRIRGWLKDCRGIECVLRGGDHATLSIAQGPFDRQLDAQSPADFILLARVDARCESGKVICLDRVPELHVVKIERASRNTRPPTKLEDD